MKVESILFQLDITWELFLYHIQDLSDEEALWCKKADGLQIHQIDGKWQADWPETEEYDLGPASIAWTMWHIIYWWEVVLDYSFGDGSLRKEDIEWPGSVKQAVEKIDSLHSRWIKVLSNLTLEQLQSKQYTKWPFSNRCFYDLALWINTELMKNVSEIGYGRYLYAISK